VLSRWLWGGWLSLREHARFRIVTRKDAIGLRGVPISGVKASKLGKSGGGSMLGRRAVLAAGLLVAGLTAPALQAAPAEEREAWDAIYIGNEKVGHTHIKVSPVKDSQGRPFLRIQVNTVLSFKRDRDRVNMELRYGTIETEQGEVLRLDTRTRAGAEEMRAHGDVIDGVMNLSFELGNRKQEARIPWGPEVRGPYAAELSLSRDPIQPGATRSIKTFIPDLNQICTTHLRAVAPEEVLLGGGQKKTLLRVEQTITGAKDEAMPELDTTLWVDSGGQILKSRAKLLGGLDSYRTTRAAAVAPNGEFDLLSSTIIKTPRPLPRAEETRDVVYAIKLTNQNVADIFPDDQRQTVKAGASPSEGQLEVRTDGPNAGSPVAAEPLDPYTRANPLLDSDDEVVQAHTRKAIAGKNDPWERAVAIQDWVFRNMRRKNFSTAFASASEVARSLEGDCTEHSVLTAAMCRAAGVPSRFVVGLVYVPHLEGFGPHAWTEVLVNGRWVAIDATFNQKAVDATHLKLAVTNLDGVSPFEAMLPVTRIFNALEIRPLEVR
jgi:transglutaminase-like putative cysteine protease